MSIFTKSALAAAVGGALLLGGCAADPYYNNYGYAPGYGNGYAPGYDNGYAYGYDQPYYGPAYVEPSVGFGIGFADYGGGRHWDHDRGERHERHGDHGDRGGHEWHGGDRGGDHGGDYRNDHGQNSGG